MPDDPELLVVYAEVRIKGDKEAVQQALENAKPSPSARWVIDPTPPAPDPLIDPGVHFTRLDEFGQVDRRLWMAWRDRGEWYIENVIAEPSIDREEYNRCVAEFTEEILRPSCPDNAELIVDPIARPIDGLVSERVADQLRSFSGLANKASGIGHPSDHARWQEFVVGAHNGDAELDARVLERWLREVEGWPEDRASRLADYYEYGRDLLSRYDRGQ